MDHVSFLVQERLESVQVILRSFSGQICHQVSTVKDGTKTALIKSFDNLKNKDYGNQIYNCIKSLKEAWIAFRVVDLYDRCVYFFLTEVSSSWVTLSGTEVPDGTAHWFLGTRKPHGHVKAATFGVTRTHVYFGGMCFIFGTLIGIGMGVRIKDSVVAPQKMRAVVTNSYRGLEAINIVEDVIAPRIASPDQVLVQVKAAGIDYLDIKISEGYGRVLRRHLNKYNPNDWGEFPVVLGRDCSGIVVAVGKNVTKVDQGDEVWLAVPVYHQGTLSEYIVVAEDLVAQKPAQLTHECAAALPYNIMKAWDALVNQAGLGEMSTAGKRVLIHAGASGVGVVAVQLVRAWGGHVTTTVNSQMLPLAQMLGADDVITYDTSNFEKELLVREKYDVIFNPLGPILPEDQLLEFCTAGGAVVTAANPNLASDSFGFFVGLLYTVFMRMRYYFCKSPWVTGGKLGSLEISGEVLEKVTPLVATGQLQAIVDKTYSAQDAEVAFHHITKGEPIGKTVIRFRARPIASRFGDFSSNCSL